jgi:hypothetical protein
VVEKEELVQFGRVTVNVGDATRSSAFPPSRDVHHATPSIARHTYVF